ncbi:hypothetical protein CY35_04G066100 [Sphagnum magellanicum]|nr:hypothetical protein CY35_04G066100 [Sphagnum magellanicum]
MSTIDEELNAMLQTDHHSSPAHSTLASVVALTSSPSMGLGSEHMMDIYDFSSQYSSLHAGAGAPTQLISSPTGGGRGNSLSCVETSTTSGVLISQTAGGVPASRSMAALQQQPLWSFGDTDQKFELDPKNRVMKIAAHMIQANNHPMFRPTPDAPGSQGFGGGGSLQRYHSAPSSLLQSLVDEDAAFQDAFSQVSSSPLVGNPAAGHNNTGNHGLMMRDSDIPASFFSGNNNNNLTPITEGVPQPMETDKLLNAASSTLHSYNQFLSPPTEPDQKQPSHRVTSMMFGIKQESKPPAANRTLLAKNPHQLACKDNQLVRQSSLPADWFATLNDPIDDLNSQIPFMTSSPDQESLSGGISEETGGAAGVSGKSSMYSSQDDSFLFSDTTTTSGADGGLWHSPTSPVGLGGKRLRGVLGDTTVDRRVSGEEGAGALRGRLGEPAGTLIRHSSLPATINRSSYSPTFDDDLPDISVPCQTRAKRGCATHPRSIAERVRRTKISERMKRLQDLVPNMDKQTNTSDMLDEAVEYVKQLKQQVQDLSHTVVQLREMQQQVKGGGIKGKEGK